MITKTKDREVTTKEVAFKRVFGGTHQKCTFNHVKKKKIIEMGLVKLRGLREEVFVAVEITT